MVYLFLPVVGEALEKARRNPRLVPITKTVTRDGTTYQQTWWVVPEQAKVEDVKGAQLDLFDRAPDKSKARPSLFEILDKVDEGKIDKFTRDSRELAGRLAAFAEQFPTRDEFNRYTNGRNMRSAEEIASDPRNAWDEAYALWGRMPPNFRTRNYGDMRWEDVPAFYRGMAKGYLGLDAHDGDKSRRVRAKWEKLPQEDFVRLALRCEIEYREAHGKSANNLQAVSLRDELELTTGKPDFGYGMADEKNREKAWRVVDGIEAAPYTIGRRKFILKAKEAPTRTLPKVDTSDPVAAVKQLVARGVKTWQDASAIGEIIYNATITHEYDDDTLRLDKARGDLKFAISAIKNKMSFIESNEAAIKMIDEDLTTGMRRSSVFGDTKLGPSDVAYAQKMKATLEEEIARYKKSLANNVAEAEKHQAEVVRLAPVVDKFRPHNTNILDFLAKVRPMGPGNLQFADAEYKPSRNVKIGDMKKVVREAMSVFPTDWLAAMEKSPVQFKFGSGKCAGRTVSANWKPGQSGHSRATQAHEIGHRIEHTNNLHEICRQFMYSLADDANGSRVKSNKAAMRNWQKGLESPDLPSQYCGVLYDHGDTEVISMASQYLFHDYERKLFASDKHKKYWHFILGLWAGA